MKKQGVVWGTVMFSPLRGWCLCPMCSPSLCSGSHAPCLLGGHHSAAHRQAALAPISNSCLHSMHPSSYCPHFLLASKPKPLNCSCSPCLLLILCLTRLPSSHLHQNSCQGHQTSTCPLLATSQSQCQCLCSKYSQHSHLHLTDVYPGLLSSAQPFSSPWAVVGPLFSLTLSH